MKVFFMEVSLFALFSLVIMAEYGFADHGVNIGDTALTPVVIKKIVPVLSEEGMESCIFIVEDQEKKKEFPLEIRNRVVCEEFNVGDTIPRFQKVIRRDIEAVG